MTLPISFIKEEFHDFDQFRDVLSGWDVDVTQVGPGSLDLTWEQVAFGDQLTMSRYCDNVRIADRMAIEDGRMTFVVCFSPNIFCGLEAAKGSLLIFGPGREYRSVLPAGFESFEVCGSTEFLMNNGVTIGDKGFKDLSPEKCVVSLNDNQLDEFRRLLQTLRWLSAHQSGSVADTLWATAIRDRALNLIASALRQFDGKNTAEMVSNLSDWLLATRALEHIDRLGSQHEPIAAMSKSIGCSTRAMQIAFKNTLGITPLQYYLARRLQLTRNDLLAAHLETMNVTQIAAKNEFFHFGRFSQYYRDLFGERPSDTLRKTHQIDSRKL